MSAILEVKFRLTELCRLHGSDRRVRLHRDRGDSGSNEAERTNSCIGEALVDGGAIKWEPFHPLQAIPEAEIEAMSMDEFESYKNDVTEKNASTIAEEIQQRIDDERGLGETLCWLMLLKNLVSCIL